MFDEDKSGKIDEDEFFFLLQYLGIEVRGLAGSVLQIRKYFYKYSVCSLSKDW